jgi:hypothetical protein
MARMMESLATVNSLLRTLLAIVVVGGLATGSWFAYSYFNSDERAKDARLLVKAQRDLDETKEQLGRVKSELDSKSVELEDRMRDIAALQVDLQKKEEEIQRLDTSLRLLKVTQRVARLSVIDQGPDNDTGEIYSLVEFVELDDNGTAIGEPKKFRIKGDVVYIDTWLVKFEDRYIEEADLERSTSLVLFRRLFGQFQEPNEGYSLDEVGVRPQVYSTGGEMTPFEKKIWDDFWSISNDQRRASELGIRAAHGDAPSQKIKKGMVYKILLRASDGLSIIPDPDAPPPVPPGTTT